MLFMHVLKISYPLFLPLLIGMMRRIAGVTLFVLYNSSIFDCFEVQGIDSFSLICVAQLKYLEGIMMLMGLQLNF